MVDMSLRRRILALSTPVLILTSSCAADGATAGGADLGWLWGLCGVVVLFVLGGVAYKIRHRNGG